jgi:hypothetical protein
MALAYWNDETRKGLDSYLTHIHVREYDNNDTSTTEKRQKKRNLTSSITRKNAALPGCRLAR